MDELSPPTDRILKMYIVELDDDNREKVMSCMVRNVMMKNDPEYANVSSDYGVIHTFKEADNYTVSADLVPLPNGTYWMIEDFSKMEGEEEGVD